MAVSPAPSPSRLIRAALCGSPNCGKTTLFNALTGLRQHVANYPGVTVERAVGRFDLTVGRRRQGVEIIDIPGTYSLSAFSPDEYIAARALFGDTDTEHRPDLIVCVIDATSLERGLYLLFQVQEIGLPVVVALTMMDTARQQGCTIDTRKLSGLLGGIPVVPVQAQQRQGIDELKTAIVTAAGRAQTSRTRYPEAVNSALAQLRAGATLESASRAELLRILLDRSGPSEKKLTESGPTHLPELERLRHELETRLGSLSAVETSALIPEAERIRNAVVTSGSKPVRTATERLDSVLLHPLFGPLILVMLVAMIFQSIFSWAQPLMEAVDSLFGSLASLVAGSMSPGPLQSLVTDGIIGGVGSVLVFLPQIVILFLFIAILEDSGYMPRMAFLVDRAFSWCGLSGKSFIPLLSSFACAVPGIMATRTIENRTQRLITILVAPLMTCSARLPVYAILIAAFVPYTTILGPLNSQGLALAALYALGLVVAILVSLVLSRFAYREKRGSFLMEFPTYKRPTLRSVAMRVYHRVKSFVVRAGTVIMAITIIIWALSYYPHSAAIDQQFEQERQMVTAAYSGSTPSPAHTSALDSLCGLQAGAHLRNSYFARIGRTIEPLFEPLGWDWKITMAVLASFPAREVIIATLGTIYNLGEQGSATDTPLMEQLRQARWEEGVKLGTPVFTTSVALSIAVFFALCCQCGATVVTIKQEAGGWRYAVGVFVYMTALAYLGALLVYQLGIGMGW